VAEPKDPKGCKDAKDAGTLVGAGAGALGGARLGAQIGAPGGVLGAAVGAAAGALVGMLVGAWGGREVAKRTSDKCGERKKKSNSRGSRPLGSCGRRVGRNGVEGADVAAPTAALAVRSRVVPHAPVAALSFPNPVSKGQRPGIGVGKKAE
jgi:hypothetical protein